jgi:hypothetical protein
VVDNDAHAVGFNDLPAAFHVACKCQQRLAWSGGGGRKTRTGAS